MVSKNFASRTTDVHEPRCGPLTIHPPNVHPDHAIRAERTVNATTWPLYPGKETVRIVQKAGWGLRPIWMGEKNLATTGVRTPNRPARSESNTRPGI